MPARRGESRPGGAGMGYVAMTIRLAYPYLRYSSGRQSQGDSSRRQGDWFEEVCRAEGWQVDTSFPLEDRGKSAYTGEHLKADLGRFLAAVNSGRIPRGSVLLVEELDRLDRRAKKQALPFIIGLLTSGIDIRTRDRHYTEDSVDDLGELLDIIIKQGTANEESRKKSVRVKANWDNWFKQIARGERLPPPGRLPPWVCWKGTAFALVPGPAAAVRLAYRLAADGFGLRRILEHLNGKDGIPPISRAHTWQLSYLGNLLKTREVLGELREPKAGKDVVHKNVYPAVVTETEYARAREALEGRKVGNKGVGRDGAGVPNLFSGLLIDARDGSRLYVSNKGPRVARKYLVSSGAIRREPGSVSTPFPLGVFEAAILMQLGEVDPREILGQRADEPDEVLVLGGELKTVEAAIATLNADLDTHGESPTLHKRVREREAQQRDLAERLARAKARAAHPLSECWGEAKAALDAAPDKEEARLRLRAALRRIVDTIHVLIVPRDRDHIAAVQVDFRAGARRSYLIWHRPPVGRGGSTPGWWRVCSWKLTKTAPLPCPQHTWVEVVDGVPPADWKGTEAFLTEMSGADLDMMFGACTKHELP